ncbi:ABC transporter permease [Brachybacterium sp. DNPG3]
MLPVITAAVLLRTLLGVGLLVALTAIVLTATRAPRRWAPALAILRGMLQLAAISVVLTGVITNPWWVGLALAVMFAVAVVTSARRLRWTRQTLALVAAAMAAGVGASLTIVFATGAIALSPRYALAIGGIVIGNTMACATLAGRRLMQAADERWDEIEGWLGLGATPRRATEEISRHALAEALIPSTDQTRTTGLVTLPGAFVGAIFGGISPLEAGRFQVVVLAAIMASGAITAAIVAFGLGPTVRRGESRAR